MEKSYGYPIGGYEEKIYSFGLTVSPGLSFFPAKILGLELAFDGIEFEKSKDGHVVKIGGDHFSPRVGAHFYF